MKRTIEIAGKESMIIDADGKDASNHFSEGFPNQKPGSDYEYFSCGFQVGLNAPRGTTDPAMNKWIEEMETTAKKYSEKFTLVGDEPRVTCKKHGPVFLEGEFTAEQLKSLAEHMIKNV